MKRIAIFGVLAAVLVLGFVVFNQQPAMSPSTEPVVDDSAAVAPEVETVAEAPTEDAEQPQMVEESAADEDESRVENRPIILAQADLPATPQNWKFTAGTHYARMVPTQPTVGGADKIEVAEFFWYGCPHCFDFEPHINRWLETKPANVRFVRVPAVWNALVKLHAQLYYTEEVLARNGKIANPEQFRTAVFAEYRRGNRMASEAAIMEVFEKHGVSGDDFADTWKSFEVAQKLRVAQDLARRYSISGVPSIVVNGKYRTGAAEAGSFTLLLEVIDELIVRESVR